MTVRIIRISCQFNLAVSEVSFPGYLKYKGVTVRLRKHSGETGVRERGRGACEEVTRQGALFQVGPPNGVWMTACLKGLGHGSSGCFSHSVLFNILDV